MNGSKKLKSTATCPAPTTLTPPPPDFGGGTPLVRRYPEDAQSQRNWSFVEELPIP